MSTSAIAGGEADDVDDDRSGETKGGKSREERRKKRGVGYREGSLEVVAMIDDQHFLSGGDSGSVDLAEGWRVSLSLTLTIHLTSAVSLWNLTKKKPIFTIHLAHGLHTVDSESEGAILSPRWITSIACLGYGDVFATGELLPVVLIDTVILELNVVNPLPMRDLTGSWDGQIRLWQLHKSLKSFSPLSSVPAKGFVNALQFARPLASLVDTSRWRLPPTPSPTASPEDKIGSSYAKAVAKEEKALVLVATLSKEPRMGRWMTLKEGGVKNGVLMINLGANMDAGSEVEEAQAMEI